jgi:uncharacterized membrane-anchored protein
MTETTIFVQPSIDAPARWHRSGLLVGLVGLALTAVLGWMVWDRVSLLKHGREIVLPVTPVDPRSLFRGDYVILGYGITQAPAIAAETLPPRPGRPLYVTIETAADGSWKAIATGLRHPGKVADSQAVILGRDDQQFWQRPAAGSMRVRYGIESFFVPEGKGLELEKAVRDKKISARIAVDAWGRAAIKGLLVDGKPLVDEPLL